MRHAVLAVETSSAACSVAVKRGDQCFTRHELLPRRHQERLPAMISELLEEARLGAESLQAVAFGCGPGSFTGLRLAAATAQAWSLAHGLPVYAVSSLAAIALRHAWDCASPLAIGVLVKARPGEVYRGDFFWSGERLARTAEDRKLDASVVRFDAIEGQTLRLVGDGCLEVDTLGFETRPAVEPSAEAVLGLIGDSVALSPEQALPTYLRPDGDWSRPDTPLR